METRKYNIIIFLLALILFTSIGCKIEKKTENENLFVPTEKWQLVKEGQILPKGLHVRIDLTTGKKEAKLLDTKEQKGNAIQIVNQEYDGLEEGNLKFSDSDLKAALKNIKNDEGGVTDQGQTEHPNKFRSYKELKQELNEIHLSPKSDSEILKNLVDKYEELVNARNIDKSQVLSVIEDINYLIHQYDNAVEFLRLKGFEEVIYKNLNSSFLEVKLETLKLLGSLVQNNAKVQIYALETGALDNLLRMLVLNSDNAVKNRVVFALSSLMRHFPLAQLKFVENAGLSVFFDIVSKTNDIKIQLRIVTLIHDLILEHLEVLEDESKTDAIAQYRTINLKYRLYELDWCKYLTALLENIYKIDRNDHDGLEKSLSAILVVVDDCSTEYINTIQYILEELEVRYTLLASASTLSDNDGFDVEYLKRMQDLCVAIINYNNTVKSIKTEL